jgi:hypothetical protein
VYGENLTKIGFLGWGLGLNWGLVAGKTQTYFPWGSPVNASIALVWFHDIFNKTGEPYSPYEIKFFKDLKRKTSQLFDFTKMVTKYYRLHFFVLSFVNGTLQYLN